MATEDLVVFDTCTLPEYYNDVHKILSFPRGYVVTYDYSAGNIDAEALVILKRLAGAREKRRVLLAYMQANQYKKGDPSPESRILDARDPRVDFQSLLSTNTWNLALAVGGPEIEQKRRAFLLSNMRPQLRHQLLKYALDRVGLSTRIFYGNRVGLFIGAIDRPSLDSLANGSCRSARPSLSWEKAVHRFKSEYGAIGAGQCTAEDRQRAIHQRAARAVATDLDDILLSHR